MHKAEVLARLRGDQQATIQAAERFDLVGEIIALAIRLRGIALRKIGERRRRGHHREAARVGAAAPQFGPVTIRNRDVRAIDWTPTLERRHPHQRVRLPLFEMHREIGDECRRRDVHRFRRAQQHGAEASAFQFDDVQSRPLQRNSHHLEGIGAVGLRHRELPGAVSILTAEHRLRPLRFRHPVKPRENVAGLGRRDAPKRRLDASQKRTIGIAAELQLSSRDLRLEISHCDRQHRIRLLNNSEARGKLGERRELAGLDGHRKARRVRQFAPGAIDQLRRDLDFVLRRFFERTVERK